jgi:hypothetical protein
MIVCASSQRALYVRLKSAAGAEGLCSYGLMVRDRHIAHYEGTLRARGESLPALPDEMARLKVGETVDVSDEALSPTPTTAAVISAAPPASAESAKWTELLTKHEIEAPQGALPAGLALDAAFVVYEASGRTGLLAHFKSEGVAALPTRQKLANAISKEVRLRGGQ